MAAPKFKPRPALIAFEAVTLDRFARLTEDVAVTFAHDGSGEDGELMLGRPMRHYAPALSYARGAVAA